MKLDGFAKLPLVSFRWLTVACFEIKLPDGFTIITDPFIGASKTTELTAEAVEGADLILITHTHYDHVTDVKMLMEKFKSKVLVGDMSAMAFTRWLDCNPAQIYPMSAGLELDFGQVRVKSLFGRHGDPRTTIQKRMGKISQNPIVSEKMMETQWFGTLEYRNYLVTLASGFKILFWGSDVTTEQGYILNEIRPDAAFMQLRQNGLVKMAADAGVKILVPHHMDTSKTPEQYEAIIEGLAAEFSSGNPGGLVLCPEHGKWYDICMGLEARK
jgi:L-ascorbate metabolism protein UlaG (beta-lactamase superfamily)